jgi:hypothetical protein
MIKTLDLLYKIEIYITVIYEDFLIKINNSQFCKLKKMHKMLVNFIKNTLDEFNNFIINKDFFIFTKLIKNIQLIPFAWIIILNEIIHVNIIINDFCSRLKTNVLSDKYEKNKYDEFFSSSCIKSDYFHSLSKYPKVYKLGNYNTLKSMLFKITNGFYLIFSLINEIDLTLTFDIINIIIDTINTYIYIYIYSHLLFSLFIFIHISSKYANSFPFSVFMYTQSINLPHKLYLFSNIFNVPFSSMCFLITS